MYAPFWSPSALSVLLIQWHLWLSADSVLSDRDMFGNPARVPEIPGLTCGCMEGMSGG